MPVDHLLNIKKEFKNLKKQEIQAIFTNKQEASGLLSKLGITTPLSKVPILGDILF